MNSSHPNQSFIMDGHTKGTSSRKSYELKDKRHIVQQIDGLVAGGFCSRRKACAAVGIRPLYYTRWKKILEKADELNSSTEFVPYNTRGTSRKIHPGRESVLAQVKEQLRAFTFKLREQGVQVTNRMVMREAGRLLPAFKAKTRRAQELAIHRFTQSVGLAYRCATHTAQKHFMDTEAYSKDFIAVMKSKLQGRNLDDVLNMDQTPIPFSFHSNTTLEVIGARTVHARASTTDTKRVTLAATVTASGKMLTPFVIFKGKPQGWIANRKFGTYPESGRYACQDKAWMDEAKMNEWIDTVLQPWKANRDKNNPSVEPPILILDAYRVHQMGTVVNWIQSMGIEVVHILAGCTYLCQPISMGINKPIKCRLRQKWEDWMMEGKGIVDGVAKEPSRKLVAEWIIEVYDDIPEDIGRNAWKRRGYKWV